MAKKGEEDPRWIVEAREDGKNVNAWHWTETDFSNWAKNKVNDLLANQSYENDQIEYKTKTVTTQGDVSVNTRKKKKKKTFLFYELDVTIPVEGNLKSNPSTTFKGTIQLPYISEENDDTDFEIKITVEGDSKDHQTFKDNLRSHSTTVLREKIPQMLKELRDTALGTTQLQLKQTPTAKLDKLEVVTPPTPVVTATKPSGPRLVNITVTEKFVCRPMDLFLCFVDINRVKAYAGGDAQYSGTKGGKFSLFGGAVTGEIVDIESPSKIVQKWRFSTWPEGLFSDVTMNFEEKNGKTVLSITHKGIPEGDKDRTEAGWSENFCRRIKGIFGFGGKK